MIRFGTAGFLSSQLMLYSIALYAGYFKGIEAATKLTLQVIALCLTLPVLFYSGMPVIRGAMQGLKHRRFNMDSLIAIGASSAFLFSIYGMLIGEEVYFDTAAMIITLILLGRYLESVARGKASETIEKLHGLAPREATRLRRGEDASRERIPVSALQSGDLVEVKPGERIPADGCVMEGRSEVDESLLSGESKPVGKIAGSAVIGGSTNLYGSLVFEVTRTGKDTVLSGIIRAVEDAQTSRPKIQSFADRVVGIFVPAILILGLSTFTFYFLRGNPPGMSLMTAISVIVIACPCSLGLATPLAVMLFASVVSSRGILVRSGNVIENAGRCTHVIFDKTGTITSGKPSVREVAVIDDEICEVDLISVAASLESLSEHSIGRAVTQYALQRGIPLLQERVSEFQAVPGKGVRGTIEGRKVFVGNLDFMRQNLLDDNSPGIGPFTQGILQYEREGDTIICIGWGGRIRALVVISDAVRQEAPRVVGEIEARGISVLMVSGDNEPTTVSVAARVGIATAF
ncbi:MAG: heavy metal translocating P-type ATPase, partial [Thermodesulfovibrionales bacterium]